jgi:hypothetical protein
MLNRSIPATYLTTMFRGADPGRDGNKHRAKAENSGIAEAFVKTIA